MTILRSREIPTNQTKPLPNQPDIEPSTPARTQEPNVHNSPDEITLVDESSRRRCLCLNGLTEKEVSGEKVSNSDDKFLSLRSGKRVAKRTVDCYVESDDGFKIESFESELGLNSGNESKRKKVCVVDLVEDKSGASGDFDGDNKIDLRLSLGRSCDGMLADNKNKGKEVVEDLEVICVESYEKPSSSMGRKKYTREEKGKGIQVEEVCAPIVNEIVEDAVEEMEVEKLIENEKPPDVAVTEVVEAEVNVGQTQNQNSNGSGNSSRTQHFRDIAKKNALKFAYFDAQIEEEDDLSDKEGGEQNVEDWPGPFSTAMKIIKDREENVNLFIGSSLFTNRNRKSPINWVPSGNFSAAPRKAPSLKELSLRVLVKNADAITSLDYIPDALRIKLCQLLCDSRRMNVHVFDLLVRGSPTEIRVPDCSWLTEEEFTECFKNCDTSNLTVLQLDHCGRCMPDYVLHSTLARSPKQLPMLSSLSLSGACRLSDVGLRAIVSAAPAITSINLNQCSLLTSFSIYMLSDSLGSVLRELYINECQNMDLKLILSALKKFEKLEVLSLADLPSVRGRFLRGFLTARGKGLKQLILTNSEKLTDSSIKGISENCPNLIVLDLANVCKLTDAALGYLANGCHSLEKLIFCRNSFSDEAVAAFVETASGSLKELSLNNVKKVSHNTALALAKHSDKLQILDLSWCRDMPDNSLGYIVDNCSSLKVLKIFGCTQVTDAFVKGHSNPNLKILGLKMDPFLNNLRKSFH
ncbi:F-box protein SKP2A [Cardamine amara subsp. amara]|uniref:F-box protein SKP2A n=1 Tax=Cardamine amara subsp. amara TaxID=228776 RepID=A0ABD1BFC3_CARAN